MDATTLKKLGFAPNNESYVINILRFLGLIDENGKKSSQASEIFTLHDNKEFEKNFSELIKISYKDLFELHGDNSWELGSDGLITFFRSSDQTTAIVGRRQANTFITLAGLSGQRELPPANISGQKQPNKGPSTKKKASR